MHTRHHPHHARVAWSWRDRVKLTKVNNDVVLGFVVHNGEVGINAASQLRGESVLNFLLLWFLFSQPPISFVPAYLHTTTCSSFPSISRPQSTLVLTLAEPTCC